MNFFFNFFGILFKNCFFIIKIILIRIRLNYNSILRIKIFKWILCFSFRFFNLWIYLFKWNFLTLKLTTHIYFKHAVSISLDFEIRIWEIQFTLFFNIFQFFIFLESFFIIFEKMFKYIILREITFKNFYSKWMHFLSKNKFLGFCELHINILFENWFDFVSTHRRHFLKFFDMIESFWFWNRKIKNCRNHYQ